jgi:hypothetical protein
MDDWASGTHGVAELWCAFGVVEIAWFGAGQRKLLKLGMSTRQFHRAKTRTRAITRGLTFANMILSEMPRAANLLLPYLESYLKAGKFTL